jgi:hypothetical protein
MGARGLIGPPPLSWRGVRVLSSLAEWRALWRANSRIPLREPARSSLARRRLALMWGNPLWELPLRHYRVSHLGAETAEDNLEIVRRHRGRPRGGPRRLDVVLVVRAGDGSVLPAPGPAVLGMPRSLAGRGRARPLARPQSGVELEQGLAEGAALPTASLRGPGHEGTSAVESATIPRAREAVVRVLQGSSGVTEAGLSLGGTKRRELTRHEY